MPEFTLPVDIGNRACDHCGVAQISRTLGFNEPGPRAERIGSVYGKLRRAELRERYWTCAVKVVLLRAIDTTTMLLAPALWSSSATYFVGSIVTDDQGTPWVSRIRSNLNFEPGNVAGAWEPYFGPLTVPLYDSTQTYELGELVYTAAGDGTNRVYQSLVNANSDNPATATAWSATTTYFKNQVVTRLSVPVMSLIDLNINQDPHLSPSQWSALVTYAIGDTAGGSDGVTYTSASNGNIGNDPTTDGGVHWTSTGVLTPWTASFTGGTGSIQWLQVGGAEFPSGVTLTPYVPRYPLGTGPLSQQQTRNVYKLPAAYLRKAPQDPKAGAFSWLGAPSGRMYDDWVIQSGFLISGEVGPILFRFVADLTDVTLMDELLCETIGYRIGLEVAPFLAPDKLGTIAQGYERFKTRAGLIDAIENDAIEPPLDDFIACRL